jgi:hypothetical protein
LTVFVGSRSVIEYPHCGIGWYSPDLQTNCRMPTYMLYVFVFSLGV